MWRQHSRTVGSCVSATDYSSSLCAAYTPPIRFACAELLESHAISWLSSRGHVEHRDGHLLTVQSDLSSLYASTYPGDVVGMVLVDPIHPSEWFEMTEAEARRLAGAIRLSRYGASLARLGVARLISVLVRLGAPSLARTSVSLLTRGTLAEADRIIAPLAKLPSELRQIIAALCVAVCAF